MKRNVLHLAALGALLVGCDGLELDQLAQRAEQQLKAAGYLSDCSAETPICEPGCGDAQQCAYTGASCECVAADHPNRLAQSTAEDPAGYDEGGALLSRPSRSTTIDLTGDDRLLAMVNTDEGSVSFFDVTAGAETRISRVATSGRLAQSEPMNVVLDPAGAYAFVANRAAGTVSRIADVRSAYPIVDAEVDLGGEPIGLALDPTGKTLWVTNWVSGYVHVLDTASMTIQRQIKVGGNPWAITITNDGDADGADEKVLVTQFFGRPRPYVSAEANDVGREGVVQVMDTYDPTRIREITLAPLERCFVSPDLTSDCFANQLLGITLHRAYGYTRAYVVSVAASPRGPVQFNHNVQALVSVIDVDTELELHDYATNLNTGVAAQVDNDGDDTKGRRFVNAPNAIEFVDRDDAAIGYVTSAGSDIVLRVAFAADGSASVGAENAFNIPTGQNPTGIVATHGYEDTYESTYEGSYAGPTAFVSNLISRDVSVLALEQQAKVKDIASGEQPAAGTPEFDIWRGKRFFNTSTGIWSKEGWGSCQSCHPMG
ncbi:MAG TPA: hypothetical protein VNN80_13375, partial [Polyangiaceae bacterium]|nr:hypothetical protein [Polyangiaceae bacterium]